MKGRRLVAIMATALWSISSVCTVAGVVYSVMVADMVIMVDLRKATLTVLALGLLPWTFAYATTRVLYGIQALYEE